MIITGIVNRFLDANTDTDVIIPARFLKRTSLSGFEQFAFFEKRYSPETICQPNLEKKDFVFEKKILNHNCLLNHIHSTQATFLITWLNFGCGSSREHAVYALKNYKVIIGSAPPNQSAFADIFRDNCRQNLIRTPIINDKDHKKLLSIIVAKIEQKPISLSLDSVKKKLFILEEKWEIPYQLPDDHEEYILKAQTPFKIAEKYILQNSLIIDKWNQKHKEILAKYPNSTIY
jgi:3-isopropylmalate/(R)-2-methylmalate dehydratase small subunit